MLNAGLKIFFNEQGIPHTILIWHGLNVFLFSSGTKLLFSFENTAFPVCSELQFVNLNLLVYQLHF